MQQPEDNSVTDIAPKQWRSRIAMNGAAEQLRRIRVIVQSQRKRLSAEVKPAAGCMRSPVQIGVRRHLNLLRHLERDRFSGFQCHFNRLPRRVPRLNDVDRMRHRIMDGHHQLTETSADPEADRFIGMNIRNGPAIHQFSVRRIMIG